MNNVIVSKAGIHCIGPKRTGYGEFCARIDAAGRRISVVKVRDDFGAVDQPLARWPETLTIGVKADWDDADYNVGMAEGQIATAARQNPAIKYWERLNERNGDWSQQADFYIALMPRLAALGIGLCMFNCASGTPQYPGGGNIIQRIKRIIQRAFKIETEEPYAAVARACKFAKDHDYKVILGLHEYSSEPGQFLRYKVLADYLEEHDALIPIVITEANWDVGEFGSIPIFMEWVRRYDAALMQDKRVLGFALFTLGGGGWAAMNYQTALPALGEYIATVTAPTPPPPASSTVITITPPIRVVVQQADNTSRDAILSLPDGYAVDVDTLVGGYITGQ